MAYNICLEDVPAAIVARLEYVDNIVNEGRILAKYCGACRRVIQCNNIEFVNASRLATESMVTLRVTLPPYVHEAGSSGESEQPKWVVCEGNHF